MCGRYTATLNPADLAVAIALDACAFDFHPRYNIAPTQTAPVIARCEESTVLRGMRWGLIPSWAMNDRLGYQLINAKVETAAAKPAFREAWKQRRCLVPADGFYEWERLSERRVPWHFRMRDGSQFCFAGLCECWRRPPARQQELFADDLEKVEPVETFTILTTVANELLAKVHDRMPVMLRPEQGEAWLREGVVPAGGWSFPAGDMAVFPANPVVNQVRHEGADCLRFVVGDEKNPWSSLKFD